jgi:hypothetical protein
LDLFCSALRCVLLLLPFKDDRLFILSFWYARYRDPGIECYAG